jgi:hypothetical protein
MTQIPHMPIPEAGRPFLRRQFFPDTVKAFMQEKEQTCPFLLQNKEKSHLLSARHENSPILYLSGNLR